MSVSLNLAKNLLKKKIKVVIDRPVNSRHPKYNFIYESNYGYVEGVVSPDGEELDVYFLGVNKPLEKAEGIAIAVVHRIDDDDDKLIVVPEGVSLTNDEIEKDIKFQEQWFKHEILR
jgi:inorganic pyrophosphatase